MTSAKQEVINTSNRKEIFWNVINSVLAGTLILLGALTDGEITIKGFILAGVAGGVAAIIQFQNYWNGEKKEYSSTKLFKFL